MLLRVFTLTLSPGSNSFSPPFCLAAAPPPCTSSSVCRTTLLGHYKSNPLQPPRCLHDTSGRTRAHLLTFARSHARTRALTTRTRAHAHACTRERTRHIYRPTPATTLKHGRAVARQVLTGKHGIEAAGQEARDSLIRLARGVTVISIGQSRPVD